MTAIRSTALAIAILAATPAFAQTSQNQDAHHPDTGQAQAEAQQPAPPAGSATRPGMPGAGMMGPGMMGGGAPGGMMGSGTTMGGRMMDTDMMGGGMMGGGMMENMSRMMGMMSMMGGAGMRPGAPHIEGRLAFLKTELKITDAQASPWNDFAAAVRVNAKTMAETHQQVISQGAPKTLPERLALERKALSAHLEALDRTAGALDKLYEALSDDQKKVADEIVVGPMGMPMGMM